MHIKDYSKTIILLVLLALPTGYLFAQEEKSDCVINLEKAQDQYDQGRIQDVEPLIGQCLENKEFNKVHKTQALKLLTLSYLFLEEPEKAEGTMLNLLQTSHEFAINEAIDPSEFINLYNKFRHEPLFSIGLLGGALLAKPIVTHLNSTQELNEGPRQEYIPKIGFRAGLNLEYKLMDRLYLNPGVSFTHLAFTKIDNSIKIVTGTDNVGFEGEENQNIIELTILAQYHLLEKNRITLFAAAGVTPQFLLDASYPGDAIKYSIDGSAEVKFPTIELDSDRTRFNLFALAVAGIKYKVTEGFVTAQIRYSHGITQASKPNDSLVPSDPNLVWELTDAYDGFRLHDLGISIGYTRHIFIPKKLK